MRVRSVSIGALAALLAVVPLTAPSAQEAERGEPPPAFASVEAKRFLGVFALGALAYTLDSDVRSELRGLSHPATGVRQAVVDVGNLYGSPGAIGLGLALWGGGRLAKRPTVAAAGFRALEAIAVSGVVTSAFKETMGRARPNVATAGREDWQLFRGARSSTGDYESFPSGHATAAFAFAAAVTGEVALHAPEHAKLVGVTTFGLAGLTAFARMHDDRHWLSDVTVGAGIGTVTALAIRRWHETRPDNGIDRIFLRPVVAPSPFGGTRFGLQLMLP
jgi:membrane-associated phospholipid phosphatase